MTEHTKGATAEIETEETQPAESGVQSAAVAKLAAGVGTQANGKPKTRARADLRPTSPTLEPPELPATDRAGISRREFLTYAWGAALGLLAVEWGIASFFLLYPRFRAGEFGGKFFLGPASSLPSIDAAPIVESAGKFWLVNTEQGPKALYVVCTHLGCIYKWEGSNNRFECPCHGSKFTREGYYIEGPAPRSLDQFVVEVVENGTPVATTEDTPEDIVPPAQSIPTAEIVVDTGKRILGKSSEQSPARRIGV